MTTRSNKPAKTPMSMQKRSRLRIFLSHKLKNSSAATELKRLLLSHGDDLHVFVAAEKRAGTRWEPRVERELSRAHWLVLLYTQEDEEWDWCLYESGFFSGKHHDLRVSATGLKYRLICLHPKGVEPPNPFRSWHSLPAIPKEIGSWLKEIYSGKGGFIPVNKTFAGSDSSNPEFTTLVDKIVALLRPPQEEPEVDDFFRRIEIELTPEQMTILKQTGIMPPDVTVYVPEDTMDDIFGSSTKGDPEKVKWSTFVSHICDPQKSWIDSIAPCLAYLNTVGLGSTYLPLLRANLEIHGRNRLYRPIITRRRRVKEHWTRFEILFATTPDTVQLAEREDVDRLTHLLLLARTFRWGILCPRLAQVVRASAKTYKGNRTELVANLITDINCAVIESANRGIEVEHDLESLFPATLHQFYCKHVWAPWVEVYPELQKCFQLCRDSQLKNPEEARKQMVLLRTLLKQLLEMNGLFITLTASRLLELASDQTILGSSEPAKKLRQLIGLARKPASKKRVKKSLPRRQEFLEAL